jgi:hypothetical protein
MILICHHRQVDRARITTVAGKGEADVGVAEREAVLDQRRDIYVDPAGIGILGVGVGEEGRSQTT